MFRAAALVCCAALATGCLVSDVRVTVKPDGSGTVRYTTSFMPSRMAEAEKLFPPQPGDKPRPPIESLLASDPRFSARVAGSVVRLRSARPIVGADTAGREMVLEFDDVSKVDLELLPQIPGGMGEVYTIASADHARPRLTLSMADGPDGHRLLTAKFPSFKMDPAAEPPGASVTGPPDEMAQLRQVLKGARLTIAVETTTPIVRTNSPHQDGNEVVLLDVDVEQALFSRQIDMLRASPATFDEYLWMLGDLPGVRIANDHVVTIEFQGSPAAAAAQPPPATEIYLATLDRKGGTFALGPPANISNDPGYDNQPSFTPDGRSILFTSARGSTATPATTDIYRYDIASKQIERVTRTPESEYSPTVMPDGRRFSVIRVEADGTQRLWSFALDGGNPSLVFADIKPVGYHAWIDDRRAALFVLGGDGQPSTLQIADTETGKAEIVARNIGRSLQRMPSGAISFVQRTPRQGSQVDLMISQLTLNANPSDARLMAPIVAPAAGMTEPYPVWLPDGTALMAVDRQLFAWRSGDQGWRAVADLSALGLSGVTRLAVSPKGDRLALVALPR